MPQATGKYIVNFHKKDAEVKADFDKEFINAFFRLKTLIFATNGTNVPPPSEIFRNFA